MWKVFLVISSVILGGAAYLSYSNMEVVKERIAQVAEQNQLLEARQASLAKTNEEVAQLEQSIQMLKDEAEKLGTEKIDLDAKLVEAQSNEKAQAAKLVTAKEDLEEARSLMGNIAKVEALQKEMNQIRAQVEEAEIEVVQMEGAAAAAKVEADRLSKVTEELKALRLDQEAGLIRGEFQSEIRNAYNQWGFVVVQGGNDQGVVNRAQMDVYRRGQPICKLLVTSVEPTYSVADIIPGSLAPGQSVQMGDTVVKTVRAMTTTAPSAPAGGAAAPAATAPDEGASPAPAPAADDPFGGGMSAPAAEPDPFGGSAPAEPDPFGGGGGAMEGGDAPAAPATPAEPDPFQ
ncbi:MAG: hypothetical protein P1U86_17805 [Verrucomicrobiales bacterium]|nr:hypothetical protein [Verrucomicrobiales bacterium]